MEKLIKKGAEAEIWLKEWMGRQAVFKVRKPRGYMIAELDEELRRQRTIKEARTLVEAKKVNVLTPTVYFVDMANSTIIMQYIRGDSLRLLLKDGGNVTKACRQLGEALASLHSAGIIHGDPTTSNFILRDGRLYALDFGLSIHSTDVEDKAVDIHLLKEILSADIPDRFKEVYSEVLESYVSRLGDAGKEVVERSKAIELRGRYARGQWG
ncbi:MAG: KEOPS complex kinase/ATPase Bud32 [Conexivisphaerales archaeon]